MCNNKLCHLHFILPNRIHFHFHSFAMRFYYFSYVLNVCQVMHSNLAIHLISIDDTFRRHDLLSNPSPNVDRYCSEWIRKIILVYLFIHIWWLFIWNQMEPILIQTFAYKSYLDTLVSIYLRKIINSSAIVWSSPHTDNSWFAGVICLLCAVFTISCMNIRTKYYGLTTVLAMHVHALFIALNINIIFKDTSTNANWRKKDLKPVSKKFGKVRNIIVEAIFCNWNPLYYLMDISSWRNFVTTTS